MPICRQCGGDIPNWIRIEGSLKNLSKRKFCLVCSPFGGHNTSSENREKKCLKCGEADRSKFYKNRSTLCVSCDNLRSLEKQRGMKRKIVDYLGGKCSVCGYSRCLGSLHLHHPGSEKDVGFAHIKNWKWERALKEISKCVLVCANCHGEIHSGI